MKRTFKEFIQFFRQDEGSFGEIARAISDDPNFPTDPTTEEIESYIISSGRYSKFFSPSKELSRRYKEYTDTQRSNTTVNS